MPNIVTQTQLVTPTNGTQSFALQDMEMAKFVLTNGTVAVRQAGGATDQSVFNSGTTQGNLVSGVYQSSPDTITSGSAAVIGIDQNRNVKVREQYAPVAEDNTNGVIAFLQKPVASSSYSPSEHTNFGAAAGTGALVKGSAGNVYSVFVTSATTAIRYFQLFNQSTVPVVGQTPVASYPLGSVTAGGVATLQLDSSHFAPSKYMGTGIAAAMSSTQGTLGTASITAADYSWIIKYT